MIPLYDPAVADSTPLLGAASASDPYSLSGGTASAGEQISSGDCTYSTYSELTTCIMMMPPAVSLDPEPRIDPTIITDPVLTDPTAVDPYPVTGGICPVTVVDPLTTTDPAAAEPDPLTGVLLTGGVDPLPADFSSFKAASGVSLDGGWLVLQDGSFLLYGHDNTAGTSSPALVNYYADGSINMDFGNNGRLTGPAGATWLLASQNENGSIQIQGSVDNGDGTLGSFLEQFTSTGQLDTNFGGGTGSLVTPDGVSFNGSFQKLSNGDILAGATSTDGNSTPVVVDYTSAGVVNSSFGNNGEIVAPEGVTSEWFYLDATTGDVVISDSTYVADGSSTLVSTSYSTDGQIDPSSPLLVSIVEPPIAFDSVPVAMYNMAPGFAERSSTGTHSEAPASLASHDSTGPSNAVADSESSQHSQADSIVIALPETSYREQSFSSSTRTTTVTPDYGTSEAQGPVSTSPAREEASPIYSSGIGSISALKLVAEAASKSSRISTDDSSVAWNPAADDSIVAPAAAREMFPTSKKSAKDTDPEPMPEVSKSNQEQSEEEIIEALLAAV